MKSLLCLFSFFFSQNLTVSTSARLRLITLFVIAESSTAADVDAESLVDTVNRNVPDGEDGKFPGGGIDETLSSS